MLKITFFGYGNIAGNSIIGSKHPVCLSENPKDKRLRVSIAIEWDDHFFVIDCGPDFRQQMLKQNARQLDGIFYPRTCRSHCWSGRHSPLLFFDKGRLICTCLTVYKPLYNSVLITFLTTKNKYPGAPSVNVHKIDKAVILLAWDKVKSLPSKLCITICLFWAIALMILRI